MRIIVWGINYAPELTGIAPYNKALCDFLGTESHDVEMVTAFPYYPVWKKSADDKGTVYRTDMMDGVPVHRCWHYVPSKLNALKRILHEGSFVLSSFLRICFLKRPDLFIVISPPLLIGFAAWLAGLFKGAPFVFHVQDLQPDAALGLGMLKKGWFAKLLYALESFAYKKAARISGISEGMLEMFRQKKVPEKKIIYFPNGVTLPDLNNQSATKNSFRERHGLKPETFLYVYSGNLGVKQGLETVVEAARILQSDNSVADIKIVICGDGARRESLAKLIDDYHLNNVLLLPLQPEEAYREMLMDMDCCLIPQQAGTGSFFFPSKLLLSLALAKPALTIADEDSAVVRAALRPGGFGINVEPAQPAALADALKTLTKSRPQLERMGMAGRRFVEQFEMNRVLERFSQQITHLDTPKSSPAGIKPAKCH